MDNPYKAYLENEFDEMALMKETHNLLIMGKIEEAKQNAMKVEAVRYVKQSLYKVEQEIKKV